MQLASGSSVGSSSNGTKYPLTTLTARTWGKVCVLFIHLVNKVEISSNTSTQVVTLTNAYKPPAQAPAIMLGAYNSGYAYIEASGAVKMVSSVAIPVNKDIYLQATYLLT